MAKYNYQQVCQKVVSPLGPRQKEVILRRFGLAKAKEQETLQKIGDDFGITRERVRQIERDGFLRLQDEKEKDYLKNVFSHFENCLQKSGGVKREDVLLADLGGSAYQNHVSFLLTLGDAFYRFPENEVCYAFWTTQPKVLPMVKQTISETAKKFAKTRKPLAEKLLLKFSNVREPQIFFASIETAKQITKGPLGQFGLVIWPEIKPRGVKDKAYLALKKTGKPLHFREIAVCANGLQTEFPQEREVLPQTVHNELIRDERFVLVGRGVYALTEWGYQPGTVKQVIALVLKQSKKPLSKDELVDKVMSQRMVKRNTILLNLQNGSEFLKDSQNRYTI